MATRLYLPSTGTPAVTPQISPEWSGAVNVLRRPLNAFASGSAMATTAFSPDTADHLVAANVHFCQFTGDILPRQVIEAQAVKLQLRVAQTDLNNNLFLAWKLYAVAEDGLSVMGTLVPLRTDGTETVVALTSRSDSATTAQFNATDNFRLVLEVGLTGTPVAAGGVQGHNGSMSFGDSAATDLPEDDTATGALNPWLQFARTVKHDVFGGTINYAFQSVCQGGGHVMLNVSYQGNPAHKFVYTVDEMRRPINDWTDDEKSDFVLKSLKLRMQGKTRSEMMALLQAPGGVTVTV